MGIAATRVICLWVGCLVMTSLWALGQSNVRKPAPRLPVEPYREHFLAPPDILGDMAEFIPQYAGDACLTPDGKYLFIATAHRQLLDDEGRDRGLLFLLVYNMDKRCYSQVLKFEQESNSTHTPGLAIHDDGTLLALTWFNCLSLFRFDATQGRLSLLWSRDFIRLRPIPGFALSLGWRNAVAFSADGKRVMVSCPVQPLAEFDVNDGHLVRRIRYDKSIPEEMQLSFWPKNTLRANEPLSALSLYFRDKNREGKQDIHWIVVVDARTRTFKKVELEPIHTWRQSHMPLCFHPCKDIVAGARLTEVAGQINPRLELVCFEFSTNKVRTIALGMRWLYCRELTFSPDGKFLLVTPDPTLLVDPNLVILDAETWQVKGAYRVLPGKHYSAIFAPRVDLLVLFSDDGHLVEVTWSKLVKHIAAGGDS